MTTTMPHVDLSRFRAISPRTIVLAYLRSSKTGMTEKVMTRNLVRLLPAEQIRVALADLRDEGLMTSSGKLELSDAGRQAAVRDLGRNAGKPWDTISARILPQLALGLDTDAAPNVTIDALRANAIAIGFGLTVQKNIVTKASVLSALVWQTLKAAMPSIFGSGPFPLLERLGPVEKAVLARLVGTQAKTTDQIFTALAAAATQIKKSDADSFRKSLIAVGLQTKPASAGHTARAQTADDNGFASRVASVASDLSTPPFRGRVSISQVYDAYGQTHSDAGSLATFKARLVEAAQARSLELGRLDLPEQMDKDRRLRSESRWGDNVVHFVIIARD